MRSATLTLLLIFLSSCATTEGYRRQMNRWQGQSINQVIRQWGVPDSAIKMNNGHRLYQYTQKTVMTAPYTFNSPFYNDPFGVFPFYSRPWFSTQLQVLYCRNLFETNAQGRILSVHFRGNNCIA